MIDETRQALLRMLVADAKNTGFFDVMRIIEQLTGKRFDGDALELSHDPSLSFPTNDIARVFVDPSKHGERFRVVTTFLGLTGTSSPLASYFTEQVLSGDDEDALRMFYDVFHDLLLRMLYRSWRGASLRASLDDSGSSAIDKRCATFVGVDPWTPTDEHALANPTLMSLADYQRGKPQSMDPEAATAMLRRLLPTLPIDVSLGHRSFVRFGDDDVTELGAQNVGLGEDLVYGLGIEDTSATVRVVVGPVAESVCEWLMPDHEGHSFLSQICERVFGGKADVELEVLVAAEELPFCDLRGSRGAELGVDSRVDVRTTGIVRVRVALGIGVPVTTRAYLRQ